MYRPVKLVIVSTPGPRIATWGVYAPSFPLGNISWAGGAPFADSTLLPTVEVVSNASSATAFSLTLTVTDATGAVVATTGGSGSVPANGAVIWAAPAVTMPNAALWHLVAPPLKPALYRLATTLTVGGVAVDAVNVTFGVRSALFNADRGFALNGVPVKIAGSANHQDFAAVGVAVPAHIQWYRVQKMKDMNGNGWRTAHNTPTPALLDACDELGMVVWDGECAWWWRRRVAGSRLPPPPSLRPHLLSQRTTATGSSTRCRPSSSATATTRRSSSGPSATRCSATPRRGIGSRSQSR